METRSVVRYSIREALGLVGMGVALFWSAGRTDWWQAWAALGVMLAWTAATAVVVFRIHPELLADRLGRHQGDKSWDAAIVSLLGLVQLVRYILAGLDQRHGWAGEIAPAVQWTALFLCVLGYGLFIWATVSNPFFSRIVRIQAERGHTVITGGPYRYLRHPAYSGAIVYELTVSLLLNSWWAFIPSILGAAMLVLRTALEDRTLLAELEGYKEYARKVRFRLIPSLW